MKNDILNFRLYMLDDLLLVIAKNRTVNAK